MNITPKAGPAINKPLTASTSTDFANRAKAIAVASGNDPSSPAKASQAPSNPSPVPNPTQVSAEELGAIRGRSAPETSERSDISDAVHSGIPSEASTDPKPAEEPISSQYAIIAKKEKALRMKAQQQEQALRAREEALRAKEEALKTQSTQDLSRYVPKDRFQQDPLAALAEVGLTYDQLVQAAINGPNPQEYARDNTIRQLESKIKALEDKQTRAQQQYEERDVESRRQALRQMELQAQALVSTDPAFELIKDDDATKAVIKLIERTFDEDGVLLSVEDAAQQVEEHLTERAIRQSRLNKIQQRLKPAALSPATQKPAENNQQQTMKTLTNSVGSTKPLSARDRAILAAKGQLK